MVTWSHMVLWSRHGHQVLWSLGHVVTWARARGHVVMWSCGQGSGRGHEVNWLSNNDSV
jgi:hypothetical protein